MKKVPFVLLLILFPVLVLATDRIDVNSSSLSELDKLAGIGPAYAQRIIDGRPYSSLDDLLRIKGIGPATLQKIKNQGYACVDCQTATENSNTQIPTPIQIPDSNAQTEPAQSKDVGLPTVSPTFGAESAVLTYPSGVFINEILASPKGADETDEWIEIYNSNNFDVDLSGWQMQDKAGTINTFTISSVTKILANGLLVFRRPETKIMLNNEGDGLNLLSPDGKTADSIGFPKAPTGQSYAKVANDWNWSTTPTPATGNIITTLAAKALPKSKKSDNNKIAEAGLAVVGQAILNQENLQTSVWENPWFLFFAVLATTIILAVFVLIFKIKFLNKSNVRT